MQMYKYSSSYLTGQSRKRRTAVITNSCHLMSRTGPGYLFLDATAEDCGMT